MKAVSWACNTWRSMGSTFPLLEIQALRSCRDGRAVETTIGRAFPAVFRKITTTATIPSTTRINGIRLEADDIATLILLYCGKKQPRTLPAWQPEFQGSKRMASIS